MRDKDEDRAALRGLEKRFGLAAYEPQFRGALEDFCRHLAGLGDNQRFAEVCTLISSVIGDEQTLDEELVDELLRISNNERVVRFSFAPCLLPCLLHAQKKRAPQRKSHAGYEIRYAGVGLDKELMAFASFYLNLAIYTESNPPWEPDALFENGEPNSEPPDLEISFPPTDFRLHNAPHLEARVRASKLPRAVDRGKYDLESVMLAYLCESDASALVFTSESFLSSTKQSRLLTRQHLLDLLRIRKVTELKVTQPHRFLIELGPSRHENEAIQMAAAGSVHQLTRTAPKRSQNGRTKALISVDEIRSAGDSLKPARYLAVGPTGGRDFAEQMNNISYSTKYRLADFFEITRPKTTKNDPVGTFAISEMRAGNISANGEILGALRKINVRSTLAVGLEEQVIKLGDILFAHRGPIGHVAYVTDAIASETKMWAGQTLLIFRARKKNSGDRSTKYCDPRVLFMYLLAPDVRASWSKFTTGDRSPAIPIGQIESFSLPENLILPKKPKQVISPISSTAPLGYTDLILSEFQDRQKKLMALCEIQKNMDHGLDRVWEAAWTKLISYEM